MIAIVGTAVALLGVLYGTQSLFLGISLAKGLPRNDQWLFVEEYYRYLDGEPFLGWAKALFGRLSDYRPLTTRLVLFSDAVLFRMAGLLPVLATYCSLAGIAYLTARISAGKTGSSFATVIGFAILLGLTWSIVQFENLGWGFQVGVAFAHLFALLCYWALGLSLAEPGARARGWLAIAIGADFLAVFSQGLGPLTVLPAIAIAIWLRAMNLKFLIFLFFHILFSAPFMFDFVDSEQLATTTASVWSPVPVLEFVAAFLTLAATSASGLIGLSFTNFTGALPIDKLALATFASLVVAATWYSAVKKKQLDLGFCVLLAACSFVFLEAVAVALARGYLAARHATPSVMFIVFLLGAVWRLTLVSKMRLLQIPVLGAAAAALIAMNASVFETEWRHLATCIDQATHRFNRPVDKEWPCVVEQLAWPPTSETRKRFLELRLGPFADD